ncbi:MAG: type II and III secretion system protein family protein [Phycisphaerales bacterium]|nr:type II and III secretion system protein family protein [Phycisphaerales bacterium]
MRPQFLIAESRRRAAGLVAGMLALFAAAPRAAAQDAAPEVAFTVRQAQNGAQMITVPVNQGALVDFNLPVSDVRIANPEIADAVMTTPNQLLIQGRAFGTTQLIVVVDGGHEKAFTVAVDLDLERLAASIRTTVPRAKVDVSALLDAVVLTGTVPDTDSAERIMQVANIYSPRVINHMRVAGVYQVLLRCTVAEVNRSATRQLGFNGWMAGANFPSMFMSSNLAGINPVDISAAAGFNVQGPIPFGTNSMNVGPAPTLTFGFPDMQMQVFIRALRENGLLQVLAEPNLVTISGQEASFLAGGEYPVPVAQRDSVTVEFREFGVRLNFLPAVLSDQLIRLQVAPEVSEPDFSTAVTIGGFVVPGLIQRRVETVVEIGPGQTFAIGGLLSEKTRASSAKVPGLGDVPVLGALFSSVDYQSNETELVILVTPELVAPLNPDQVTYLPGTDHIAPNDWELFVLSKLEGEGDPRTKPADDETPDPQPAAARLRATRDAWAGLRLRGPYGPAAGPEGL